MDYNKKYNDYIICNICGKKYTRYNKQKHLKTKYHILFSKFNNYFNIL